MPIQEGQNTTWAFKVQSGLGTPATGSGGTGIRFNEGVPGLEFERVVIDNNEVRRDGQTTKGRLGSGRSNGSGEENLCVGGQSDRIEAMLRGTFVAQVDLTQSTGSLTSIACPTSTTIVNGGGSWLTSGVRKGDKIKLTGFNTAANNGKWFRVVAVTTSTITLANYRGAVPLVVDAAADTTFTLSIAKTVLNTQTVPTERYFTHDQYDQTLDLSEQFTDVKVCKMEISAQADANVKITFTYMGLQGQEQVSGSSPVLTSPTYGTSLPLVFSGGTVRIMGVDYTVLTDFRLTLDSGGQAPGTNAANPSDVYLNNSKLTGTFSAHKQDTAFFAAARLETQADIFLDFVEDFDADPQDFVSFYIGNVTLGKASAPLGTQGPRVLTVPWFAGKDETGGQNASTMIKVSTSV